MLTFIFIAFLAIAAMVALVNWRLGVLLLIVVGSFQDPVRKLMPGAPAWMVLAFFPVWLASFAGALNSGQWRWSYFSRSYPALKKSISLFLPTLVLAAFVLMVHYGAGAWKVAVIGMFTYSLPIVTLVLGFSYARGENELLRFIRAYCFFSGLMLIGGVLETMNIFPGWKALGTEALGIHWIKYVSWGHTIDLIAGFYRSPDIMGWHAATLTMLSLTMVLYGKAGPRWFWLLLAAWGLLLVLVSGRNKMLGMIIVWGSVVALIYLYYGRLGKLIAIAGAGGLLILAVLLMSGKINLSQDYILYASQFAGGDVMGGSPLERVDTELIATTKTTYRQSGFFGKGIGVSAQGIQHLGLNIKRSWQESGLSRILVELGIPGLLAILFFVWSMGKTITPMITKQRNSNQLQVLQICLIAFACANASNFIISHQVFSDGLVIVMLTMLMGMMLAIPTWPQVQRR